MLKKRFGVQSHRTRLFVIVIIKLMFLTVQASAEPVAYEGVLFSASQSSSRDQVADILTTIRLDQTLDLTERSTTHSIKRLSFARRTLTLSDPTASGLSISGSSNLTPSSTSTPELPELRQNGRVITFEPGVPGASRLVVSPEQDLLVDVVVRSLPGGNSDRVFVDTTFWARRAPNLSVSDLKGDYAVFAYSNVLTASTTQTSERHEFEELQVSFEGNGDCSASSAGLMKSQQQSSWPDLSDRITPLSTREAARSASDCSYTVSADASALTITLSFLTQGATEQFVVPVLVSDQNRYLIGERVSTVNSAQGREWTGSLFFGARTGAAATNESLDGVYLLALFADSFAGQADSGSETNFAARYALSFGGSASDNLGYSECTILGATLAGSRRVLGGQIPQASGQPYEFSDQVGRKFSQCRYRARAGGAIDLEFRSANFDDASEDIPEWVTLVMRLADDGATLFGGAVATSADSLPEGITQPLPSFGSSTAYFAIAQAADAAADAPEVLAFSQPYILPIDPTLLLAASVLPTSRSVGLGTEATAFATIINAGTTTARDCHLRAPADSPVDLTFQETDSTTNQTIGNRNGLIDIPAGQARSFLIRVSSQQELRETELALGFTCVNSNPAETFTGINTLLFSSESAPSPDVIALSATVDQDGIVKLDPSSGNGVFSMATINLGTASDVQVSADTGATTIPMSINLCQTDPINGACINPTVPSSNPVTLRVATNETPTFGLFISATNQIEFDPAANRVFVRIRDSGGVVRGGTSVAVTTSAPGTLPLQNQSKNQKATAID